MDELTRKIYHSIVTYPMIFPSRESALTHFYAVTGTGYEWTNNGKIEKNNRSEYFPRSKKDSIEQIRKRHHTHKDNFLTDFSKSLRQKLLNDKLEQTLRLRERVFKAEEIAKGQFRHDEEVLWVDEKSQKSNLWNIPKNAKKLYIEGAVEIINTRLEHAEWFKFPEDNPVPVTKYEEYLFELKNRL